MDKNIWTRTEKMLNNDGQKKGKKEKEIRTGKRRKIKENRISS